MDDWFHSGDLAVIHKDGYIQIKDRSKDIIISGGENISSVEIENVLYQHPSVGEAAVVAMPDEVWGETPCAFVELKTGEKTTEEELIAFCKENMAKFKRPKKVVFGALPKPQLGKSKSMSFVQQLTTKTTPNVELYRPSRRHGICFKRGRWPRSAL